MEIWQLSSAFPVRTLGKFFLRFDWKVPCFKLSLEFLVLSTGGERWGVFFPFLFCLSEDCNHVSILSRLSTTRAFHLSLPTVSYRFPVTVVCLLWTVSNCSYRLGRSASQTGQHVPAEILTVQKACEDSLDHLCMTSFLCFDPGCPWHDLEPVLGQVGWSVLVAV